MASAPNTVCKNVFSRYSLSCSSGVNCFGQVLNMEDFNFCFPPGRKCLDAVKHLAKYHCAGVLVIPVWPRAPWFSWFFPDGSHCAEWVKTLLLFSPTFVSGPSVGPVFKGVKQFETACIEFDFQSYSLSYNITRSPTHCLLGGCVKCA